MKDKPLKITQSYQLPFPRAYVWEKLNDPLVLKACIVGCHQLERVSAQAFHAVIRARVGQLKKDFNIKLGVDDSEAPSSYLLSSKISAGILGDARASARVELIKQDEANTMLHYVAEISAKGLLKKTLPLIQGAAQRRVNAFFDEFVAQLTP